MQNEWKYSEMIKLHPDQRTPEQVVWGTFLGSLGERLSPCELEADAEEHLC